MTCRSLKVVLLLVVVLSSFARLAGGGWFLLMPPGCFSYPLAVVGHLMVHTSALRGRHAVHGIMLKTIVASHVAYVLAFVLQYEMSDVHDSLVIMAFFGAAKASLPAWLGWIRESDFNAFTWNLALFVPLLLSWAILSLVAERTTGKNGQ